MLSVIAEFIRHGDCYTFEAARRKKSVQTRPAVQLKKKRKQQKKKNPEARDAARLVDRFDWLWYLTRIHIHAHIHTYTKQTRRTLVGLVDFGYKKQ